jgi:pullulanase/glycogen debranching enzyme
MEDRRSNQLNEKVNRLYFKNTGIPTKTTKPKIEQLREDFACQPPAGILRKTYARFMRNVSNKTPKTNATAYT